MEAAKQRNQEDVAEVEKTLNFIAQVVGEKEIAVTDALRQIVTGLALAQVRLATPILLPFGMGYDMDEMLPTPRPSDFMEQIGILIPILPSWKLQEVPVDENGKQYTIYGSKLYYKLVEMELIPVPGFELTGIKGFSWIPALISFLSSHADDSTYSLTARRLMASWYLFAMESNLEECPNDIEEALDEEEQLELQQVENQLTDQMTLSEMLSIDYNDKNQYNEDDDDDFIPSDDEDEDEDEDELVVLGDQSSSSEDEDEDEDSDDMEESEEMKIAREKVLEEIHKRHTYFPSPVSSMAYFKRMLAKIVNNRIEEIWFPWGTPLPYAVETLTALRALEAEGDEEAERCCTYLTEVITPFSQVSQ